MNGLAAWLLARRPLRILLIAAMFPLPFTNILSAALVALVAVTAGLRTALQDLVIATVLLTLVIGLSGGPGLGLGLGALLVWVVLALAGSLTGRYGSLNPALQLMSAGGLLVLLAVRLAWGDAGEFWLPFLQEIMAQVATGGTGPDREVSLTGLAGLMNGLLGASLLGGLMLALLLACSLGVTAGGPPLAPMFRELQMGRVLAIVALISAFAGALGLHLGAHWAMLLATGFFFQGLAVIHWLAHARRWHALWVVAFYGPLFLIAPLAVLIIVVAGSIGFLDSWYPLRRAGEDMV